MNFSNLKFLWKNSFIIKIIFMQKKGRYLVFNGIPMPIQIQIGSGPDPTGSESATLILKRTSAYFLLFYFNHFMEKSVIYFCLDLIRGTYRSTSCLA
jgi:hypothetical protein